MKLTVLDTNSSWVCKHSTIHTAQFCPHLGDLMHLQEKIRGLEYEFDRHRHTTAEEKAYLERQLRQVRMEKENEVTLILSQTRSPSRSSPVCGSPQAHYTIFTDALLSEKNNEIATLRQKISELMDANRRLNQLHDSRAFDKENEATGHRLEVKEKELIVQRLRNDLERHVEQSTRIGIENRRLLDELTAENTQLRQTIDTLNSKINAKENQLVREQDRAKAAWESELSQTRSCFDMRLKNRVEMTAANLMDLVEHEATKRLKQNMLSLWTAKYRAKQHMKDLVELQKTTGVFKITSRIRDVAWNMSEETVSNLYRVFHKSVVAANKKKANGFGVFVQSFKEALHNTNVYKRTLMNNFHALNELLRKHAPDERIRDDTRQVNPDLFDKPNRSIYDGLVDVESKLKKRVVGGKQDDNERFLTIYQLFMVLYRAEYPINRERVEIEPTVKEVLNALIFEQLKRLIN
jgi:hypothetical protein